MSVLAIFWKPEACGHTVLPDRLLLNRQKLGGNAVIQRLKCDFFGDFETLWCVMQDLRGFQTFANGKIVIIQNPDFPGFSDWKDLL